MRSQTSTFIIYRKETKQKHTKRLIDERKHAATHDQKLIMTKLKSFYKNLFSRKSLMSEKLCMEYLTEITTPVLSSEIKDLCDNHVTLNEIFTVLNAMSSNKTSGNAGLASLFMY